MPDLIRNKLGAYLDGELDERVQIEVQAHLESCPACRDELDELRQLSQMLRAAPQPDFTSAHNFKAQLVLQLPRQAEAPQPRSSGHVLPWMVPALVLSVWVFIQVTFGLSSLVSLANQTGLLHGSAAWAESNPQQMLWFTTAQATLGGLFGQGGQVGLKVINDVGLLAQNIVIFLLMQAGAALLYWGALSVVWHHKVKALWPSAAMD